MIALFLESLKTATSIFKCVQQQKSMQNKQLNNVTDSPEEIVLILKEQSDQGLLCLLFHLHHLKVLLDGKSNWFNF